MSTDLVLVRLGTARTALAEARTLQDAKRIADVGHAAKIYAQRQKLGEEAVQYAKAVIFEAERRIGEILEVTPRNTGAKGIGKSVLPKEQDTLADLGIDYKTSSRAQQLAALPDATFEQVKDGTLAMSTALRLNRPTPARPRGPTRQNIQQARQSATAARRQMEEEQRALSTKVWGLQDALTHVVSVLSSSKPDQLAQYRESLLDVARQAHQLLGHFLIPTKENA